MKTGDEPTWKHDCKLCVFIQNDNSQHWDIYICAQGGHLPTVVIRHGDAPEDYHSMPFDYVVAAGHPIYKTVEVEINTVIQKQGDIEP